VYRDVAAWSGSVARSLATFRLSRHNFDILDVTNPDGARIGLMGFAEDINVRVGSNQRHHRSFNQSVIASSEKAD
jgi:hypothetical protein